MAVDVFSAHLNDQTIRLDKNKAAIVVIDMINEFCKPGGKMVLPGYERLVGPQKSIIDTARLKSVPIIWVHDAHRPNMRLEREWAKRTPHCLENTWATEIIDELGALQDDIHVTKRRYSAFFQTDLDLALKDMMITQLVIFGVVTNICVRSTVHDAFFNGYEVVVPQDACAATGQREHESTLYDIATHYGVVCDSQNVVDGLKDDVAIDNQIKE